MYRKVLSLLTVPIILIIEVIAWFYIEIGFDGCCGEPHNYSNNTLQSVVHVGSFAIGILIIWLILRWGWKKRI